MTRLQALFDNSFSGDVGNTLFGKGSGSDEVSLMSPDNTSDGWLKKKWQIINGKRCLIKGGSGATRQEPYNEVLASRLMERLGIPGMEDALNKMMVLDYLIVNEDRHQNNFGAVRNAETLEWIGAAPVYDSGTSLWFDKPRTMINGGAAKLGCKPFKNTHDEQIKLVTSFDWLDLSALTGIDEELREILRGSLFIDAARCDALCHGLQKRIEMLGALAGVHNPRLSADNQAADVTADIAYSGETGDGWER